MTLEMNVAWIQPSFRSGFLPTIDACGFQNSEPAKFPPSSHMNAGALSTFYTSSGISSLIWCTSPLDKHFLQGAGAQNRCWFTLLHLLRRLKVDVCLAHPRRHNYYTNDLSGFTLAPCKLSAGPAGGYPRDCTGDLSHVIAFSLYA